MFIKLRLFKITVERNLFWVNKNYEKLNSRIKWNKREEWTNERANERTLKWFFGNKQQGNKMMKSASKPTFVAASKEGVDSFAPLFWYFADKAISREQKSNLNQH